MAKGDLLPSEWLEVVPEAIAAIERRVSETMASEIGRRRSKKQPKSAPGTRAPKHNLRGGWCYCRHPAEKIQPWGPCTACCNIFSACDCPGQDHWEDETGHMHFDGSCHESYCYFEADCEHTRALKTGVA